MIGDAFFHILPHMLGLHGHSHDLDEEEIENHEDHHEENDFAILTGKIGTLVGSMYAMWLIGAILQLTGNGHNHSSTLEESSIRSNTEMLTRSDEEKCVEVEVESELGDEPRWSTIWGIMIGDCFHNFVGKAAFP